MKWWVLLVVVVVVVVGGEGVKTNGWLKKEGSSLSKDDDMRITIHLTGEDPRFLDDAFQKVYDLTNSSGKLRKYLTKDQISELVKPKESDLNEFFAFFRSFRVVFGVFGDVFHVWGSVGEFERALGVELEGYYRTEAPDNIIYRSTQKRTENLPKNLKKSILSLSGLFDFPPLPHHLSSFSPSPHPLPLSHPQELKCHEGGSVLDPPIIIAQYNQSGDGIIESNQQGVAAFEGAQFYQSDVTAFDEYYDLPVVPIEVQGPNHGGFFGEAGLDTQYITASGRNVSAWFLAQKQFDMLEWCESVANMTSPPMVLSISWGGGESGFSEDDMMSASQCFQKLGLMGISVFAASGDVGTGKQGSLSDSCKKFDPTWPACSPFITAVGGTYLTLNNETNEKNSALPGVEDGWDHSGGGFSAVFSRPSYQDNTLSSYFNQENNENNLPDSQYFDKNGRGVPDVSALGVCYTVFSGGEPVGTLTGTSAACPTFAGMISLINDARIQMGKPTIGFLNPVLYENPTLLIDMTTGYNKDKGCSQGFYACSGWDPVTGFGTPWYPSLYQLLVSQ